MKMEVAEEEEDRSEGEVSDMKVEKVKRELVDIGLSEYLRGRKLLLLYRNPPGWPQPHQPHSGL
jgi:hypothetical protein